MKTDKTKEFIAKAKAVHGDKYDYSKVNYVNSTTKVTIICPIHGEFEQRPSTHLSGHGCPSCSGCKKLNTEEFIKRAKEVHGDKYDYSKVNYVNTFTKVTIICPKHGEFEQTPNLHLKSQGCPNCYGNKKLTIEEFIKRAKKVHGDKYDYSKVKYVNALTKVTIICPIHGEFEQTPAKHLSGIGCASCARRKKLNTEEFIKRAKEVHGDKYDYSKVNYIDSSTKVTIICPTHGEFEQTPASHFRGQGCPDCSGSKKLNTKEFIERARKVHGDKYDYSKVNYVNSTTKVTIICPIHGEFEQTPEKHLSGHGCPDCSGRKKLTTEEFIKKAKEVHGDKYDYSKVNFENRDAKVTVICPIHGEFEVTPRRHLSGQGCPDCSGIKKLNTEEFIKRAKEVHGDKYDYSKVNYIDSSTKVTIICPTHGEFEKTPDKHLAGQGCPDCIGRKRLNNERFIKKAKKVHGDKYDYSKVKFVNRNTKVTIICPIHGEFEQTPHNHLVGKGCPICNKGFTKSYKISLLKAGDLLHMSSHQLIEVIASKKLPEEFKTLIYTPEDSDKRVGKIKDLISLYESDGTDEEIKEKLSRMEEEDECSLGEKEDMDELTSFGVGKKEDHKLPSVVMSEVHTYDRLFKMRPSDDRDSFILNEETHKLWNSVLRANEEGTLEEEILKIKEEKGGEFFEYVKDVFLKEYEEVVSIEKDKDYRFKYEPSLMQKLMVFYMLHNNSFGNWCGTGAGKTNAFLFASRMTHSKVTVAIVPNDVIDTLCKSIQAIYPDSHIVVPDNPDDLKHYGDRPTYIIYNYEKMQSNNGAEETIKKLLETNKIDFICLDEVHNAKVRTEETASSRSKNIKDFITKARELNPNVKVLAMSATPFINNLQEVRSIIELITGEEHPEIGYRNTTSNIHNAYKAILLNGFRYIPKYDIAVEERIIEVDCSEDSELLKNLMKNEGNISGVENLLAQKKLGKIESEIKKGTVVYSPWVNGMADMLTDSISDMGFITEAYNGDSGDKVERKEILDRFRSGETDVLVCSKPISTGVDGLQKCCNKMIIISLPWTDADYTQLKGRIYRQGSVFDKVEFVIPQVVININDKSWSWDKMRKNAVDNKKTIGEAVVDGDIQESYSINKERLLNEAMETLKASAAA